MILRAYQPSDLEELKRITVAAFDGIALDQRVEEHLGLLHGRDWRWRKARHLDEDVAKMAGLPSIILHGLCTMAFVHDALVRHAGGDPMVVKRLAVRFNKPVLMGDKLTIDVRGTGKSLAIQVTNQSSAMRSGPASAVTSDASVATGPSGTIST